VACFLNALLSRSLRHPPRERRRLCAFGQRQPSKETGVTETAHLQQLIEPVVSAAGLVLVRVAMLSTKPPTLQVMAEDPATGQMTIDQCAALSRKLSAMLDAEDPIEEEYQLEVSSPGIDRPLTRAADFERWAGHEARIELGAGLMVDGAIRKRFQGPLIGPGPDDSVVIDAQGVGRIALARADIRAAKLVLTDRLIAETRPLDAAGADIEELEEADDAADEPPLVQ
jgi:ribosome maturation factor RimP